MALTGSGSVGSSELAGGRTPPGFPPLVVPIKAPWPGSPGSGDPAGLDARVWTPARNAEAARRPGGCRDGGAKHGSADGLSSAGSQPLALRLARSEEVARPPADDAAPPASALMVKAGGEPASPLVKAAREGAWARAYGHEAFGGAVPLKRLGSAGLAEGTAVLPALAHVQPSAARAIPARASDALVRVCSKVRARSRLVAGRGCMPGEGGGLLRALSCRPSAGLWRSAGAACLRRVTRVTAGVLVPVLARRLVRCNGLSHQAGPSWQPALRADRRLCDVSVSGRRPASAQATTSSVHGAATPDGGEMIARVSGHSIASLGAPSSSCMSSGAQTHRLLSKASAAAEFAVAAAAATASSGGSSGLPPLGSGSLHTPGAWGPSRSCSGGSVGADGGRGARPLSRGSGSLGEPLTPASGGASGGGRRARPPGPNPFAADSSAGAGAAGASSSAVAASPFGAPGVQPPRGGAGVRLGGRQQRGPNPFEKT